jgi:hypothetical protein
MLRYILHSLVLRLRWVWLAGGLGMAMPFFYSEQVAIGDEQLTYRCFIDTKNMQKGKPYSIRFFVFGKSRLHRSTQDMFVLN